MNDTSTVYFRQIVLWDIYDTVNRPARAITTALVTFSVICDNYIGV